LYLITRLQATTSGLSSAPLLPPPKPSLPIRPQTGQTITWSTSHPTRWTSLFLQSMMPRSDGKWIPASCKNIIPTTAPRPQPSPKSISHSSWPGQKSSERKTTKHSAKRLRACSLTRRNIRRVTTYPILSFLKSMTLEVLKGTILLIRSETKVTVDHATRSLSTRRSRHDSSSSTEEKSPCYPPNKYLAATQWVKGAKEAGPTLTACSTSRLIS